MMAARVLDKRKRKEKGRENGEKELETELEPVQMMVDVDGGEDASLPTTAILKALSKNISQCERTIVT
jgi:hypothetical protein